MTTPPIYLDFNASTPIAPEVRDAMLPYLERHYGNPSAQHWAARPARRAIEDARERVAALIGAQPDEIVFTSGGTESNNQAIQGRFFAGARRGGGGHVVTCAIEHPAVLEVCEFVRRCGGEVTVVPVDPTGRVDPDDVRRALRPDSVLVTIMHANNEVGTIQPLAEIAGVARERGVPFHTDAAQSVGKIPVDVDRLGVDLLSIAGHKLYAPKGVGALYVRSGTVLTSLLHGGGHERGRRSGTESALQVVGLGAAADLAREARPEALRSLRDRLHAALREALGPRLVLNGHPEERLPNTLNVSVPGADAAAAVASLERLAVSTGSACHSGERTMSPVLRAMGLSPEVGLGAVRLSVGRGTTPDEVDEAAAMLSRALAPVSSGPAIE